VSAIGSPPASFLMVSAMNGLSIAYPEELHPE
jgi:hypothetical protein